MVGLSCLSTAKAPKDKRKPVLPLRILYIINDPGFFLSHRLPIAIEAKRSGYDTNVATGAGDKVKNIKAAGLKYCYLPISRGGINPLSELRLFIAMIRIYRLVRPNLVHLVTIKPVLYGGIIARFLRVPSAVFAISGMGYVFTEEGRGWLRRIAEKLYRLALGHPNSKVIVQNIADRDGLSHIGALKRGQDVLIPGSGVDLKEYITTPLPEGCPIIVLPARMLWDKGVGEFVEASRILQKQGCSARFVLVGSYDPQNPAAVPLEKLNKWKAEGPVEWWGYCEDMPLVFAMAILVVLPSYREGTPKVLLEAAASGRAIITTDAPGCRDVVEPGINGELVPIKNATALADAIGKLLKHKEVLEAMGWRSRKIAEAKFGIERVVEDHMKIYKALLKNTKSNE